jgi:hypothetical protein
VRVFVSYRRDDAGGHAGRLVDDLTERAPWATVFQDVDSIGPGVDFVAMLHQAVASADAVLVVIGPDWTTIAKPGRGPRLMEPDDIVRLEVASALSQDKWVVPVLVGSAAMPKQAELPPDLAPLVHRNAIGLRQEAWDADVHRLTDALRARLPGPGPGQPVQGVVGAPAAGRRRWVPAAVGVAAIVLLAVAVVVLRPWADSGEADEGVDTGSNTASGDGQPSGAGGGSNLQPADPPRTVIHSLSGDRLDVEVTSASLGGGPEPVVDVTTHLRNQSGYDFAVGGATITLEVDGQRTAPVGFGGAYLPSRTDADVPLTYQLSAAPDSLVLKIDYAGEIGSIPLLGGTRNTGEPPDLRDDTDGGSVGTADYLAGPATVEELADRYLVSVPVEVTNQGPYDMNFWSRTFRLLVDGSSQAPATNLNELVKPDEKGQATLVWDTPFDVRELVLRIDDGVHEAVEIPLTEG